MEASAEFVKSAFVLEEAVALPAAVELEDVELVPFLEVLLTL